MKSLRDEIRLRWEIRTDLISSAKQISSELSEDFIALARFQAKVWSKVWSEVWSKNVVRSVVKSAVKNAVKNAVGYFTFTPKAVRYSFASFIISRVGIQSARPLSGFPRSSIFEPPMA